MFDPLYFKDSPSILLLKKVILIFFSVFLLIGMVSSHRAYFQVRSLHLNTESVLRSGSIIQTTVVSSARTYVDVQLEIIQGAHSEILGIKRVPDNEWAFFDPRTRQATLTVVLTPEIMAGFQSGTAQVRATAFGHPQWTRVPPPVVSELGVAIQRE